MSEIKDSVIVTHKFSYWMSHDIFKGILSTYQRFRGPLFRGRADFEKFYDQFVPNCMKKLIRVEKNELKQDMRGYGYRMQLYESKNF